ncbi:MAG: sigma-70 family RNA polymerase sigma factor [Phycisphaerales bacterium]|nr:MAG: sigma-70 family RNA polymerase sigma factor [Phycisphaerales bacterium]
MFRKALSCELLWDGAVSGVVAESQRWILSTMQKCGPELVTMLWRILGNEQDVCDAYQDTFLQLAHFQGGRKPEHVKAYVFRTANNVAISMLRRRMAERTRLSRPLATTEAENSPAEEVDSEYLQEALRRRMAQLPEHLRNVVALRDLAELSYVQVGRILGISAGTARVYRCKAVQLLAMWMSKEE